MFRSFIRVKRSAAVLTVFGLVAGTGASHAQDQKTPSPITVEYISGKGENGRSGDAVVQPASVSWWATEGQLRGIFGAKVTKRECNDREREAQAARSERQTCESLIVDECTIDGITFLASFNMEGPDRTLNAIYLDRVATVTKEQIKRGEGADFRYNRVKSELASRYGDPNDSTSPTRHPKKGAPVVLHSKWIVDGTVISLTDMILPDKRGEAYYLSVVYKPLSEAAKPQLSSP